MRHWIWCDIDQSIPIFTSASPRSILVFSGRYHIISNASLVNNCIISYSEAKGPGTTQQIVLNWTMGEVELNDEIWSRHKFCTCNLCPPTMTLTLEQNSEWNHCSVYCFTEVDMCSKHEFQTCDLNIEAGQLTTLKAHCPIVSNNFRIRPGGSWDIKQT